MSTHHNQPPVTLPPEISLLLACARTEVDDEMARRVREMVGQPINWKYLIEVSRSHGLMPLLYENLKTICPELVPADHLNRLKALFQKNTARSLLLTAELGRILDLFEAEGIASMPYKGPESIAIERKHEKPRRDAPMQFDYAHSAIARETLHIAQLQEGRQLPWRNIKVRLITHRDE